MRSILPTFFCIAALSAFSAAQSDVHDADTARAKRQQLLKTADVKQLGKYECPKPEINGVRREVQADGTCLVTWELADGVEKPGHDEQWLFYSEIKNIGDAVVFNHKTKAFSYSVRPNPDDLEKPPKHTKPQAGCDHWPFSNAQSSDAKQHHELGGVHQKGLTSPCYYKVTFTFTDGTPEIDPHISVGK